MTLTGRYKGAYEGSAELCDESKLLPLNSHHGNNWMANYDFVERITVFYFQKIQNMRQTTAVLNGFATKQSKSILETLKLPIKLLLARLYFLTEDKSRWISDSYHKHFMILPTYYTVLLPYSKP